MGYCLDVTTTAHESEETDWRTQTRRFSDYLVQTDRLIRLTVDGASRLESLPRLLDELHPVNPDELPYAGQGAYTEVRKSAAFAKEEINADFPLLHAHALMGLWGALEAMVEDLAVSWLATDPSALERPVFAKIKVAIGVYARLSRQDQQRYLVSEVKRECKTDLKVGLGQFEDLLSAIGLGGVVDARIRKVLFEAQQVRNLTAHRGGRADARFVASCPNLGYSVGDHVRLSGPQLTEILDCMGAYAITLIKRCQAFEEAK